MPNFKINLSVTNKKSHVYSHRPKYCFVSIIHTKRNSMYVSEYTTHIRALRNMIKSALSYLFFLFSLGLVVSTIPATHCCFLPDKISIGVVKIVTGTIGYAKNFFSSISRKFATNFVRDRMIKYSFYPLDLIFFIVKIEVNTVNGVLCTSKSE